MTDPLKQRIQSAEYYLQLAGEARGGNYPDPAGSQYFATCAVAEVLIGIAEAFEPYDLRQAVQLIRKQIATQRGQEHGTPPADR